MAKINDIQDPIERFCQVLAGLDERERSEVMSHCLFALGSHPGANIFHPKLDDVRARLHQFVKWGMTERFLIPSLFHHLIEHYRRVAEFDGMKESREAHESVLATLQEQLLLPQDKRRDSIPDNELQGLINLTVEHLAGKGAQRDDANRLVGVFEFQRDEYFGRDYWRRPLR